MPRPIEAEDLVIHFLNVGFGDNVLIEFPADSAGQRTYGLVDCIKFDKTRSYLNKLMEIRPGRSQLAFICATHPHLDHIRGIRSFLQSNKFRPQQFWDSGFHHASQTYQRILEEIYTSRVRMVRVSSYHVRLRACPPSGKCCTTSACSPWTNEYLPSVRPEPIAVGHFRSRSRSVDARHGFP